MRTTTMLLVSLATLMMACESATDPLIIDPSGEPAELAPQASAQSAVATLRGFDVDQVSSGVTQLIGWCDEAAGVVRMSVPGTGTATHIGRFQVRQIQCLNLVTGAVTAGEGTMAIVNGDEIYFTYDGAAALNLAQPILDLHYVITRGTGRFARARGESNIRAVQTTPSTWESTGSGWISYAASDRSGS